MSDAAQIIEVAQLLRRATRALFITGAGISAGSGLPTYRGIGGLYSNGDTEEGIPIETVLSGPMFAENPALTWKYLWQIGAACAGAKPNDAHQFIAELENEKAAVWVLTQNVDGLHRAAGTRNIVEAHGHAFDLVCTVCRAEYPAADLIDGFRNSVTLPPQCPKCDGVVRPKVVLFEENLPDDVVDGFQTLAAANFELVFIIGTSALFPYIERPVHLASANGIPCVEINPQQTGVSNFCSHRLRAPAVEAMQAIQAAYASVR